MDPLRDIHGIDPASWWPPAVGWWLVLLGILLSFLLLWWLWRQRTLFPLGRWQKDARKRLQQLNAGQAAVGPTDLKAEQLMLLEDGHCLTDQALEVCALDRGQRRFDLGASSLATLCGLVAQGLGYTFLPEIALRAERAAAPGLSVTRFAPPEPSRRIVLVRRPGGDAARWFDDLGDVLRAAGESMLAEVRAAV